MPLQLGRPPRSVVLLGAATALSLLGDQALYVLLPLYFEDLGLVPVQVGILLSANRWIRLVTNSLAHQMVARGAVRAWFVASLLGGALLTASYVATTSFALLLLARCLWGLCWSFIRHIGVLGVAGAAPEGRATQTMGYYNGIARMGSVLAIVGGGLLFDLVGFQTTLILFFVLSTLAVPCGWIATRQPLSILGASMSPSGAAQSSGGAWALLLCGFCIGSVGPGLIMSTLGFVLLARFGEEVDVLGLVVGVATLNGLLLGARWALDTVAAPVYGAVVDALGVRRSAPWLFAIGTVALGFLYLFGSLAATAVGVIVFFTCGTALNTAVSTVASQRGSGVYSRYATAGDLGSAFGPLIGWASFEYVQTPESAFVLAACLYALGMAASLRAFSER